MISKRIQSTEFCKWREKEKCQWRQTPTWKICWNVEILLIVSILVEVKEPMKHGKTEEMSKIIEEAEGCGIWIRDERVNLGKGSRKGKWSHWVASDSFRPHGLQPTRLLRPWDFPGKGNAVDCHFLLQGNLTNPGNEPRSPTLQAEALPSDTPGRRKEETNGYSYWIRKS